MLKLLIVNKWLQENQPAAFRRLCVETFSVDKKATGQNTSRLQAAVC